MKSHLLTLVLSATIPLSAAAQGTVSFATSAAHHQILHPFTGQPVGSGFTAALYWGPLGSLEVNLVQLGATTGVFSGTGYLVNGGTRTTGFATAPGASASFQIRAWNGGWSTWDSALVNGALVTKTAVFTNPTGDPFASPPGVPATLSGWPAIPEPSSLALAGLAMVGLVVFRRKRSKPPGIFF